MAAGYHFTVKLSTVFKSYFTATRVACATRVKRLTRFLARHWLEAARKLLHVRMSWNATYVRTRPRVIPLANDHKKLPACLLVWVWGSTLAAFGRKGGPLQMTWGKFFPECTSTASRVCPWDCHASFSGSCVLVPTTLVGLIYRFSQA